MKKSQAIQNKIKTITAVIPVFEEEKNIGKLLKFLLKTSFFDEIICVNDGSTDKSLEIMNGFKNKIIIINLRKNHGKGYALSEGVKSAKGEIVVFLDGDLVNLTIKHIGQLLSPVLKESKKAVLGYGTPTKDHFYATRSWVKNITGQRVYYRNDLLPHLKEIAKKKYGVEIYLNSLFNKKETKMIPLVKLTHVWNHKKNKPLKALKRYLKMNKDVAQEIGKKEIKKSLALAKSAHTEGIKKIKKEINDMKKDPSYKTIIQIKPYYEEITSKKPYIFGLFTLFISFVAIILVFSFKTESSKIISKTAAEEFEKILAIKSEWSNKLPRDIKLPIDFRNFEF